MATLAIFAAITVYAATMRTALEFWMLGLMVALVLGGSQALSRSLYASLLPPARSAEFFSFFGQDAGGSCIQRISALGLALGFIDCGMRRRVNDDARLDIGHHAANGIGISQVKLAGVECNHLTQRRQAARQFPADLAATAGKQDFAAQVHRASHSYTSASFNIAAI
jgi:hypothetical protein